MVNLVEKEEQLLEKGDMMVAPLEHLNFEEDSLVIGQAVKLDFGVYQSSLQNYIIDLKFYYFEMEDLYKSDYDLDFELED